MWKYELRSRLSTTDDIRKFNNLSEKSLKQIENIIDIHPMYVTKYYLSLVDKNNPDDPIRKMAIPTEAEMSLDGSYDTSGEAENTKMPGLQHKYAQTALILATNRCAVYCRHCFRKRLVGLPTEEIMHRFRDAVRYIKRHTEINNVLISGGDPLILHTNIIAKFLEKLSTIEHLKFIRIGTRMPVVLPSRFLEDLELLALFRKYSWKNRRIYIVTQFNHPAEITDKSRDAIDRILKCGVVVHNQTVLLKGVNDHPDTIADLMNGLVGIGVTPYYVFQCRPVKRVKQAFKLPLLNGYSIVENAKKQLNGHSKRFKYVMSHKTGKIEIVGIMGDEFYFKYHQAKDPKNLGKFFKRKLNHDACWLDELEDEPAVERREPVLST